MPSENVVKHKFLLLNHRFDRILERDQIKYARTKRTRKGNNNLWSATILPSALKKSKSK